MMKIKYTKGLLLTQLAVRIVLNVASENWMRLISLPVPVPRETPVCITDAFGYSRDMRSDIPRRYQLSPEIRSFPTFRDNVDE